MKSLVPFQNGIFKATIEFVDVYLSVEGHRSSLSILRHFVSVVQIVAKGRLFVLIHQIWIGYICSYGYCQQAVHYDICISVRDADKEG